MKLFAKRVYKCSMLSYLKGFKYLLISPGKLGMRSILSVQLIYTFQVELKVVFTIRQFLLAIYWQINTL